MIPAELQFVATLFQALMPVVVAAVQRARLGLDPLGAFDAQTIAQTVPSPLLARLALDAAAVADAHK